MIFQLTDAAVALLNASSDPITLSSFKVGSAVGYTPTMQDVNIRGVSLYSGTPSAPVVIDANIVRYSMFMDYDVGDFQFGEAGLFLPNGTLFALASGSTLITKTRLTTPATGNSIRLDAYLSMVGVNYHMFLDIARSDNHLRVPTLNSVDQLPSIALTSANVYIVRASNDVPATLAWNDRYGRWNFSDYEQRVATGTVAATDSSSVTSLDLAGYIPNFQPTFNGEYILQWLSGPLTGIVRAITTRTDTNKLNFHTPLLMLPNIGDSFEIVKRSDLSADVSMWLNTIDTVQLPGSALSRFGLFSADDVILRTGTRAYSAHQSMGNYRLTSVGAAVNPGDAVSKSFMESVTNPLSGRITAVESYVPLMFLKDGSVQATANWDLGTHVITNSGAPVSGTDLTNKTYVLAQIASAVSAVSGTHAAPVQDLAALAAIAADAVVDKQLRLVEDTGSIWRYDLQSAVAIDGVNVIDGPGSVGRWIKALSQTQTHSALAGLQGGNGVDEFYHLTAAQYNGVVNNTCPTQSVGNNSLKQASTAFVLAELGSGYGTNFLKKDGTVSMTAALNAGGHSITNMGAPISPGDGMTKGFADSNYASMASVLVMSIVFGG